VVPGVRLEEVCEVKLQVVLPTLNEAENLEALVRQLLALPLDLGIIVVDDASTDGTATIADSLATGEERLRVIHRRDERGLGTAYRRGFEAALEQGADHVLTMDCDFSHDPGAVPDLVAAAPERGLVIGSRYVPGGSIIGWSLHRRLLSRCANAFAHSLFRLPASDCTSGFRLYHRGVISEMPWASIRSTGYSFLVETLFWALRGEGVRVVETPICFRDRQHGRSKLGWREAVLGARNLLRLRLRI
jgi:dolichol-phosphate mannosyltransferase